jgi:hypothetical protein
MVARMMSVGRATNVSRIASVGASWCSGYQKPSYFRYGELPMPCWEAGRDDANSSYLEKAFAHPFSPVTILPRTPCVVYVAVALLLYI